MNTNSTSKRTSNPRPTSIAPWILPKLKKEPATAIAKSEDTDTTKGSPMDRPEKIYPCRKLKQKSKESAIIT